MLYVTTINKFTININSNQFSGPKALTCVHVCFIFVVCDVYFIVLYLFFYLFREGVWFDDLEVDMVEGELVAKQPVIQTHKQIEEEYKKLLVTGPDLT